MYDGLTASMVLAIAGLAAFALWQHRQFSRRVAEAELRRLRTQLDPHFLFNTLNAISELGYDDPEAADRAITQLSGLLRRSLDESRQQEISLQAEIDFLKDYLALQAMLLRSRLDITFSIDPASVHARVPAMILQPLAENAMTHGRPHDHSCRLAISARRDGRVLRIELRDNGPGLGAGASNAGGAGIGISNARSRLKHLYGAEASVALHDTDGGGATASIVLPFRELP
ncbi:MAG TPA: histidine kinase [Rhizomicrobium sp.]|nr:histidine kinase [Rhizomicrobium sp.]